MKVSLSISKGLKIEIPGSFSVHSNNQTKKKWQMY